jgi:hypothetical protein
LFHGVDEVAENPDWLGEIFEWISSSLEANISARDSVGRIPYAGTIFSRGRISARKPHATLLMAWLQNYLINGNAVEELTKAASPASEIDHMVVCSHDVDFYYKSKFSTLFRLLKNVGIAFRLYRSWPYLSANSRLMVEILCGKRVGEYLPSLISAMQPYDAQSTIFAVARGRHRRDPNYLLEDVAAHLTAAKKEGFSVGLHGSYESIVENKTLIPEATELQAALGRSPLGNRQHWLRFDSHENLFDAVEGAKFAYDSTMGFPEAPGFRNGASFAFPPYDFKNEKPYNFLEIPLVLMDGNVEAAARLLGEDPQEIADSVLRESRSWSWGGISVLWHNPMEPLSVPERINRVFWGCVQEQRAHGEKWMSAEQFLNLCLGRYQNAGLMKEARLDA